MHRKDAIAWVVSVCADSLRLSQANVHVRAASSTASG